jgi:hypothetical protein
MSAYLDLVKAIQNKRVAGAYNYGDDGFEQFPVAIAEKHGFKMPSLARPNFEIGEILDKHSDDFVGAEERERLSARGKEMFDAGRFHLPYPQVAYSWKSGTSYGSWVRYIAFFDELPDKTVNAKLFLHVENRWFLFPIDAIFRPGATGDLTFWSKVTATDQTHMNRGAQVAADLMLSATTLLDLPEVVTLDGGSKTKFDLYNRNRKNGTPRIPETRILRVNRELLVKVRFAQEKGTHASPVGHVRRGHWRTLPSGLKRWVRDSKVNGGPSNDSASYTLLNDRGMVIMEGETH